MLPPLTAILGGAASGKSAFAENLILNSDLSRIYVATAQAWDDEMQAKISAHKTQRGAGWQDVEAPLDLPAALRRLPGGAATLVDCATMWLSNLMLAERDIAAAEADLFEALAEMRGPVVVVTNEIGQGVVPAHAMGRAFREVQGRFNQTLAARADLVVAVMAGLPLTLKGELP